MLICFVRRAHFSGTSDNLSRYRPLFTPHYTEWFKNTCSLGAKYKWSTSLDNSAVTYCLPPGGHISVPGRNFGISVFHTSIAVFELHQDKAVKVPVVQRTSLHAGLSEYFQAALYQKFEF